MSVSPPPQQRRAVRAEVQAGATGRAAVVESLALLDKWHHRAAFLLGLRGKYLESPRVTRRVSDEASELLVAVARQRSALQLRVATLPSGVEGSLAVTSALKSMDSLDSKLTAMILER